MDSPLRSKTVPLYLLELDGIPIFQQLQLEEALLRADARNWCLINRGSTPAIVMGISGKPELLINHNKLAESPVPVIRRFSGGGTVFVDSQTFFVSWICNTEHMKVATCPHEVHCWSAGMYQSAWPSLGMSLRENDYVLDNRKFGGNAQYLCRQRWLHHSSLLWDFDVGNMEYLQMPAKVPQYRHQRSHEAFLCRLCEMFPSRKIMESQLLEAIFQQFSVIRMPLEEVLPIAQLPHRQSTQELDYSCARF